MGCFSDIDSSNKLQNIQKKLRIKEFGVLVLIISRINEFQDCSYRVYTFSFYSCNLFGKYS